MELQSKTLQSLAEFWELERPNRILFLPVWLGIGIGIYFLLPAEPPYWMSLLAAAGLGFAALRRRILLPLMLAFLGAGVAGAWTAHLAAPIISAPILFAVVEGRIAEMDYREKSVRMVLEDIHLERHVPEDTPRHITLTLRNKTLVEGLNLGDRIRAKASFFPPPLPTIPGGFQFNRHFYFQQIGGMGYSTSNTAPEILLPAQENDGLMAWVNARRLAMFRQLEDALGQEEGSVAAALMVGHQKAIPDEVNEAMRKAGLSHVLSISGAHLGLAAGIFFFLVRFVFALIPPLTLATDSKKLAAIIALLGALGYLLLAGLPVPAVRSYVMVAMVLLAVLMDRMVTPLRSLALAAFIILLYAPESILSPSFQLSFAATIGILAYYEHWRKREFEPVQHHWKLRVSRFFSGIVMTSLVATLATTPFVLHHFDSFPTYGLLGNLLAMPILSFWIMPMVVAAFLLWPLGGAGLVLPLLGWGVEAMIAIARFVGDLPLSTISLPPLSMPALVLISVSGLWLCLMQQRWRWWGLMGIGLGLASLCLYQSPDVVLAPDGKKIAVRASDDEVVMLRGARTGFTQDQWRRFLRVDAFLTFKQFSQHDYPMLRCDVEACLFAKAAHSIAIIRQLQGLMDECAEKPDLALLPNLGVSRVPCDGTRLISRWQLEDSGGMAIWLDDNGYRIHTVRDALGTRPWSQIPSYRNKSGILPSPAE